MAGLMTSGSVPRLPPPKGQPPDKTPRSREEELEREIVELKARLAEVEHERRQAVGDQINVHSDVRPGSVVGSGESQVGLLVEGDMNVEQVVLMEPTLDQTGQESGADIEARYLNWQYKTAGRVSMIHIDPNSAGHVVDDVTLDSIYVRLDTTSTQPGGELQHVPISALQAVTERPRLVILGDPGSGKTTFINYLTMCLAAALLQPDGGWLKRLCVPATGKRAGVEWPHGPLIPVRIALRDFASSLPPEATRATPGMLYEHIKNELAAYNLVEYMPRLHKALNRGECLVMFDGLDEVPVNTCRTLVRDAVCAFADSHPANRYLVTCRSLSYNSPDWQLPSFPSVTLAPLDAEKIDAFIAAWYDTLAHLGRLTSRKAKMQARELAHIAPDLSDLAENPMLLTVIAVVHTYRGRLPRERARLYQECVDLLMWRWQQAKRISTGKLEPGILEALDARQDQVIKGLYEVAFRAHSKASNPRRKADIPHGEMVRVFRLYLDDDRKKAEKFCDYVEKRAGLLVGRGNDPQRDSKRVYSFPHRTFQEFLAACYLTSQRRFARTVMELARQGDIWREVVLLAVGHLLFNQEIEYLPLDTVSLLCPESPPEDEAGWRAVWWAGEILALVGRNVADRDEIGVKAAPRVIELLAELVKDGHLGPHQRAQAADVLGYLGDPRPGVTCREPETVPIEGGPFRMGRESARHEVSAHPFRLARYPVTNAQFREFVSKGGYRKRQFWSKAGWAWRGKRDASQLGGLAYDLTGSVANRPVVGVSWYEAQAYANWLAKETGKPYRLVTEAEWERVAAGERGRTYPWGSQWKDGMSNTAEASIGRPTSVGIFPEDVTPEGAYDMGGNVWEWCSSRMAEYPYQADDGREAPEGSGLRVVRGGAYDNTRDVARCTHRHGVEAEACISLIGFRVAMDVG
jgi:formylglycine-generating enzyme required for sulfatase activity